MFMISIGKSSSFLEICLDFESKLVNDLRTLAASRNWCKSAVDVVIIVYLECHISENTL